MREMEPVEKPSRKSQIKKRLSVLCRKTSIIAMLFTCNDGCLLCGLQCMGSSRSLFSPFYCSDITFT
ncbi:hypothetical protein P8452_16348 [Trifolium repens]|nr:hypothetical protein P8452_16348 [Trifolium repens]